MAHKLYLIRETPSGAQGVCLFEKHSAVELAGSLREVFVTRERLGSTAIGHGLATPEADLPDWDGRVRMLVGWSRTPMGFWDALDGEPVWLVIASLVPLPRSSEVFDALCNLHRQVSRSIAPAVPPPLGETLARRGGEDLLRFLVDHLDRPTVR